MKHPILYDKHATNFFNLGHGVLKDAVRCIVTEERNGVFELEMTYPNEGTLADLLEVDYIIKADAGHASFSKDQLFRIERIDKSMDGLIKVYANHVSYLAQSLALEPDVRITNASANEALAIWRNSIIGSHPFKTNSNVNRRGSTHLTIQNCQNARQALGGASGSILDVWGGEYIFDNYRIDLLDERGGRANTLISYGRNLTDLDQEENISNTYTSVYPYAVFRNDNDEEEIITIPGFVIDAESAGSFAHKRVLPVDFSREFDQDVRPTTAELRALTEIFIKENEIGVPSVSIALSFVDLTKSLNQAGITYEQVNLCDTVPVYFEKLGIRTHAKVVRIEWNVLLDQYEKLEIGVTKKTLGDTIREIERDVNAANNNSNDALTSANGRNTVFFGPNEPTANRVGDLWYRPNGEHTELWVWNGAAWEFIMSTAPDEVLREQIEHEMQRVQEELDRLNATLEEEVRPDLGNNSEALEVLDKELEKINLELSDLDQQLGENKQEIKNINSVELPALKDELDQLNQETLPNMQNDLDQLNNQIIPDLNKELANLDETVSEKSKTLDDLNNIALPALQEALDQINLKYLPDIQGDLDRLNGQIIPELKGELNQLDKDLTNLDKTLSENQQALNTLNTETIPTLWQDLQRLNDVILPTVEKDLRDLETELNGLTDLTSEWRYLDTVDIDGGAIRANTITTNHMGANSIHGDRITTNTLNANRIAANTITGDKIVSNTIGANHITTNAVTAENIASGAVTTDKMTANSINGDRITTNTLNANRITAGSITTDRMTSNSINGDRISANTLNASKIVANTITGDKIAANAIQARHLTIADFTNLATVSEYDLSTLLNGSIRMAHGRSWIFLDTVNGHAGVRFLELKIPTFKVGEEFNFQFTAFNVGNFPTTRPIIRYHYTDGTWENAGVASPQAITTTPADISANVRITAEPNSNKTLSTVRFFTESGSGAVTGGQYLRQIGIYRRSNGQLIVDGSIQANHITTSAVTSDKISANAVTTGKISAGAVTTDKMTAGSINGDRIQTNTLNANRITAGSITTDKMTANSINGDRITTNTLNANRITAGSITTDRMTAGSINGDRITTNTLNANRITAGTITTDRMTAGSINGDRITTNTLHANRITANTITGDRIVAEAIGANHITANAVTADKIATGAVTAEKIAAGAITANMITTGTLNAANVNITNMNANNITTGVLRGVRVLTESGGNSTEMFDGTVKVNWSGAGNTGHANFSPEGLVFRPIAWTSQGDTGTGTSNTVTANTFNTAYRPDGIYWRNNPTGNFTHYINIRRTGNANSAIRFFGNTAFLSPVEFNRQTLTAVGQIQIPTAGNGSGIRFNSQGNTSHQFRMFEADANLGANSGWMHLAQGTTNSPRKYMSFKPPNQVGVFPAAHNRGEVWFWANRSDQGNWHTHNAIVISGQLVGLNNNGQGSWNWLQLGCSATGSVEAITSASAASGTTAVRRPFVGSAFNVSSERKTKEEVRNMEETGIDALEKIKRTIMYDYKLKSEVTAGIQHTHFGLLTDACPSEILSVEGDTIELYSMLTFAWQAIKQLATKVEHLEQQLN